MLKLFLTIYSGLEHAFEADHLLAVNTLVSKRKHLGLAINDGIFWGIGHTFTIAFIGLLMLGFRVHMAENLFHYFEAGVGLMLIFLGIYRLVDWYKNKKHETAHHHQEISFGLGSAPLAMEPIELKKFSLKAHHSINIPHFHSHKAAFWVGLVHGLAGSGALVLIVMAQSSSVIEGLWYLLIFGLGSVIGMFIAAALFSIPFSRRLMKSERLQTFLVYLSSILCFLYGLNVCLENLMR